MKLLASCAMLLAAAAWGTDPATACRMAHGADPPAHIACLEAALRELNPPAEGDEAEDLGSEQVREAQSARAAMPPQVSVQVGSVIYDVQGKGIFRLANGQVWRETEISPENQRLKPGVPYAGRIERSKLGGYRMYLDGVRRMIKVKRVE
jgi:hypothetical protein